MDNVLTEEGVLPGTLQLTIGKLDWELELEVAYRYKPGAREALENRTHGRLFEWMGKWIHQTLVQNPAMADIQKLIGPLIAAMNVQFGGGSLYLFESAKVTHVLGPLNSDRTDPFAPPTKAH